MCGRFALGLSGGELEEAIARDYFQPPAHHQGARDQDGEQQQDGNEADEQEQAGGAAQDGEGSAPRDEVGKSTHQDALHWSSFEAQSTFRPRYNVAPTTQIPVVRRTRKDKETYELDLMKWGLVPSWYSEPPSAGLSTINAQCESVFEGTPAWRQPRQTKRCLVVAQGFYEWLNKPGMKEKQPYFVKRKDGKLMAFAGLWDHCDFKGNYDPVTSCTILTVPVNKQLRFLHTRMPAILPDHSAIALWLSPEGWSDKLKSIIKPFEGELEYYAVDRGVGKVQNDSADFIKPVAQKKGSLDSFFAKQAASSPSKSTASTSSPKRLSASPPAPIKKSTSPPSTSSVKGKSKTSAQKEVDEEALNPDEADSAKLAKIEEDVKSEEEAKSVTVGKGKGKKRAKPESGSEGEKVEVLDLCESDGGKDEDKPSPAKKKKKTAEKRKEEKQTDGKGTEELTNFFPVVE
ncbi:putative peptidase [Rhodotorula toruloides]|nr:putative peptidase [Rhodotorula toruloides]